MIRYETVAERYGFELTRMVDTASGKIVDYALLALLIEWNGSRLMKRMEEASGEFVSYIVLDADGKAYMETSSRRLARQTFSRIACYDNSSARGICRIRSRLH